MAVVAGDPRTAQPSPASQSIAGQPGQSVYDRLGIRPFINASGHNTAQGGSLMPPEVLAAMNDAARRYVWLRALQDAAGKRIAEVIGVPAAVVSSGAAGAILLGAAASLTGKDTAKIHALPESLDGRNQIVVWKAPRPNYMYQACQAAGGKLVEVGQQGGPVSPEDFRGALNDQTAAILLVLAPIDQARGHIPSWESFIGDVSRYANASGVPVLVDAASELPPRNLARRLLELGVAGVIVSGGKAIRGPQSTGLLLGRTDLIEAAALNNNPLAAIGRPMKVGKEELCGVVAAVERFFAMDETSQLAEWRERAQLIARAAEGISGVRSEVIEGHPDYGRPPAVPKAVIRPAGGAAAADALYARLAGGDPAVNGLRQQDYLILNPMTLEPGEAEIVARQLRAALA